MSTADNDILHLIDLKVIETDLAASLAATLGAERPAKSAIVVSGYRGLRSRKNLVPKRKIIEFAVQKAVSDSFGASDRCLAIDTADPLVEQALIDVIERVPEIVHARLERITQDNIDRLVDAFLKSQPTAPARAAIEFDNARERARFREEVHCYTSREVAELAGHSASNASATTTRWKSVRRIIGLPWKDGDLYPAFQFQDGRPRPVIGRILAALPESMTPWQIAFWLTSSNSWLDGATPVERLDDGDAVVAAARHEGEKLIG